MVVKINGDSEELGDSVNLSLEVLWVVLRVAGVSIGKEKAWLKDMVFPEIGWSKAGLTAVVEDMVDGQVLLEAFWAIGTTLLGSEVGKHIQGGL